MSFGRIRFTTRLDHAGLRSLYAGREPFHWLDAGVSVAAFANDEGPHWHYVALGARDAVGKDLSFRLATRSVDGSAPRWPVELLQRLARHAVGCAQPIGDGWYVCFERPIDPDGALRCVALVPDPQLEGAMLAVGLHEDELALMSEDDYDRFLGALRERDPLLVTEPERDPLTLE